MCALILVAAIAACTKSREINNFVHMFPFVKRDFYEFVFYSKFVHTKNEKKKKNSNYKS